MSTFPFSRQHFLLCTRLQKLSLSSRKMIYRPVAIHCILSKVIERAIFIQIVELWLFLGLGSAHSTTTAMIQMYDTRVQAVDKVELTGVCMLDMSAAFDVVDHGIMLNKLKLYDFDERALQWIGNSLSGRGQAVYIDGSLSSFLTVDVGVPH